MADGGSIVTCAKCNTRNRLGRAPRGVPRCGVCKAPLPWIVDAGASTFDQETESSLPVLVDFWAPWCGPCRMVSPLVERLGTEHAGHVKIVKLNVDEAPAVSARYQVQGIPLLVLLRNGSEVDRLVGAVPLPQLKAWLEPHLASSEPRPAAERA